MKKIQINKHDDNGTERDCITIDLRNKKSGNNVIDIFESHNSLIDEMEYHIKAQWTKQYHPDMVMSKGEFLELADVISKVAQRIKEK